MCTETPNIAARVMRRNKIFFWCFEEDREDFRGDLETQIKLFTVENLVKLPNGKFRNKNGSKLMGELADVLAALKALGALSAVKDLVSLLVLYEFGGYYLDTTTSIVGALEIAAYSRQVKNFAARENHSLDKAYDGPRFPWIRNKNGDGWQRRPIGGLQTGLAIVGGGLSYRTEMPGLLLDVPVIDVWAAYAPVANPLIELMIVSYVSRANRLGLNSSKQPINFDQWDGIKEMSDRNPKSIRNDIIGELVIGSVFDALLEATAGDGRQIEPFTWDAFGGWQTGRFPPDGLVCVPELGIVKEYKNSWR